MTARVIGSGQWASGQVGVLTTTTTSTLTSAAAASVQQQQPNSSWRIGQIVDVRPRTWIGINRPGGTGRITKIHYAISDADGISTVIEGLDVKYTVYTGHDYHLDPDLVQPHEELETRGRRRRTIEPAMDTENDKPNEPPQQRSKTKKAAAKKPNLATSAKKNASKKKTSNKRKKGGARIVQAAVPPTVASTAESNLDIPREIIVDSSNTPGSGYSNSTSDDNCSPLGQDGIESHPVSSASYTRMMQVEKTQRKLSGRMQDDSSDDFMDCGDDHVLQFQVSPTHAALPQQQRNQSNMSAKHLASGRYSTTERNKSPQKKMRSGANARLNASCKPSSDTAVEIDVYETVDDISDEEESNEKAAARVHLSLREVFDHGVKKASQFIGDVVNGAANQSEEPLSSDDDKMANVDHAQRLNQFRTLLNEVLLKNDGMMEVETVADQMVEYAAKEGFTFDYTETQVNDYLTQLCAHNKIMRTEGWIYNI